MSQKTVAMLVGHGFEDLEFWVVYMRMLEEGMNVKIIGPEADEKYISKSGGLSVSSEFNASQVTAEEIDGILIPGGWAPDELRRNEDILNLVKRVNKKNGIVDMICHAGLVGISAGIVNGSKATGSKGIKDDLQNAGAIWVDEPAFTQGNLVWGRVVKDIPYYCWELVKAFK